MRIAILASGNGTNAGALLEAARQGWLGCEVGVVLTNRPGAGVIGRAERYGVAVEVVVPAAASPSEPKEKAREEYDGRVVSVLERYGPDLVVLAGWMRILSGVFLDAFAGRIINLHPSILPSFTGGSGIADAVEYGARLAGCSVHFVSPVLDGGPLIIQAAVPVADAGEDVPSSVLDATEARIHAMEHLILPQAVKWFSEGRLRVEGRCVRLLYPSDGTMPSGRSIVGGCLVWPPLEIPLD